MAGLIESLDSNKDKFPYRKLSSFGVELNLNVLEFIETIGPEEFAKFLCQHILVVFKNQNLNKSELAMIANRIGRVEKLRVPFADKSVPEVLLVTNKKNEKGEFIGMFGEEELGWHSNGNSRKNIFDSCVALYCEMPGEETITKWVNTRKAFEELEEDYRDLAEKVSLNIKFQNNRIYNLSKNSNEYKAFQKTSGFIRELVYEHPLDRKKGLYFPYHFVEKVNLPSDCEISEEDFLEELKKRVFKEEFMTDISFEKGDLVFSDQLHSLHKRSKVQGDRLLYRLAFNYEKVRD